MRMHNSLALTRIMGLIFIACLVNACSIFVVQKDVGEIRVVQNGDYSFAVNLPHTPTWWDLGFESSSLNIPGNVRVTVMNVGSESISVNYNIKDNTTLGPQQSLVVFDDSLIRLL